jgi:hypothetical protein
MKQCTKCLETRNDSEFFAYRTIMYNRKQDNLPHDVCKDCYSCKAKRKQLNEPISELTKLSKLFLSTHTLMPAKWELTLC